MLSNFELYNGPLIELDSSKKLINTLNAHSYNTLKKDVFFREAIYASDMLLPDGISVVLAMRILKGEKLKKIAGADLFQYEMQRLNSINGKCFFLGSTPKTLKLITERAKREYPGIQVYSYSPPFKPVFSEEDNKAMIDAVNEVEPDVLFVGMTAPKQEKWSYQFYDELKAGHICCIGAVFDFYAGNIKRAPDWMISAGLEWLYRLLSEPRRMWRRYIIGNSLFVYEILKEKFLSSNNREAITIRNSSEMPPGTSMN
ncbi:MAG: WecB/TagA/CpsF family glycosyltransferase [Fermentimonas sp.]|nr:WecB/TagA/CpsF family glycosyltransferase [Fermentimonas sp.]